MFSINDSSVSVFIPEGSSLCAEQRLNSFLVFLLDPLKLVASDSDKIISSQEAAALQPEVTSWFVLLVPLALCCSPFTCLCGLHVPVYTQVVRSGGQ